MHILQETMHYIKFDPGLHGLLGSPLLRMPTMVVALLFLQIYQSSISPDGCMRRVVCSFEIRTEKVRVFVSKVWSHNIQWLFLGFLDWSAHKAIDCIHAVYFKIGHNFRNTLCSCSHFTPNLLSVYIKKFLCLFQLKIIYNNKSWLLFCIEFQFQTVKMYKMW